MTTAEEDLRTLLRLHADFLRNLKVRHSQHYVCAEEFVLLHGQSHTPRMWTRAYPQGTPLHCYGNAIAVALKFDLPYIEGYALAPMIAKVIPHAWNLDPDGNVLDTTWCNTGLAYMGVQFSIERADDATWNGDACVLDDKHRGHPLFAKPWTGEDYTLEWPYSDRIEAVRLYRAGDQEAGEVLLRKAGAEAVRDEVRKLCASAKV